jgi:tRNA nucleotidyltransferase (CCA-adding enzyme)
MTEHWEHFNHDADIGVRGFGSSKEAAFAQAALAATAVVADPAVIRATQPVEVHCEAADDDTLLVDWLNALVYEMDTRHMLFGRFDVEIRDHHLNARVWGERVVPARHQPAVEIKGATYTELGVHRTKDDGWVAQCVVDV